jgi:phage/plasmid primase-like uncharacterized protein
MESHQTLSEYGQKIWDQCKPISGVALRYLEARGCVVPPAHSDLRWHPSLKHPISGTSHAALVALITDALTGVRMSLQRTWICADGTKASVDPPRMLLKGHRKAGGVVRLWPDEAVSQGLAIAEGIETALSAAHAFTPVWACVDAGNLAEFPVLHGIAELFVVADNDAVGMLAAKKCALRWALAGVRAKTVTPPEPGTDLNDTLMRGAA